MRRLLSFKTWLMLAVAGVAAGLPVAAAVAEEKPAPVTEPLRPPLAGYPTMTAQLRAAERTRLLAEQRRLLGRLARLEGATHAAPRSPLDASAARIARDNDRLRARVRQLDVPIPPVLRRIAECESHGNPRAVGGGGQYRGAFQMTMSTWSSVGGRGDPVDAPLPEQYRRAAILLARSGPGQWPSCA